MIPKPITRFLSALLLGAACPCIVHAASSLVVETDYRVKGLGYSNLNLVSSTTASSLSYYSQKLSVTLKGQFSPGIEIGSRISAIGISGSTGAAFGVVQSTETAAVNYPPSDFSPFIENAYIKLTRISDLPVDLIAGKQNLSYGDGLIIDDNGFGVMAMRLIGRFEVRLPFDAEVFTAKFKESTVPNSDFDVYGAVLGTQWKKQRWELAYFSENDQSGRLYPQGSNTFATKSITKQFYDIRVGSKGEELTWQLEAAKQSGTITQPGGNSVSSEGLGYVASGAITGRKTKLGDVTARALLSYASGGNYLSNSLIDDKAFSPDLTRRFDGLERTGYGNLFAATPTDGLMMPVVTPAYSGVNTLGVGADISPLYAWTFSLMYYLYSASAGPKGAPEASGFESLYGGAFSLGDELDVSARYVYSKYVDLSLSYSLYTPPKFDFWPTGQSATLYEFAINAHF